jgi:hypothetical protein
VSFKVRNLRLVLALLCVCTAALGARAQSSRVTAGADAPTTVALPRRFPADWGKEERLRYLYPYIAEAARRNGVDAQLLLTVCDIETAYRPELTSPVGAMGLTQLMPETAARFGVKDAYDFTQALDGGAKYLRFLTGLFGGDLDLILAGYNAGEGSVIKYGRRVPPYAETQGYVARGHAAYLRYLQAARFGSVYTRQTGTVSLTSYVPGRGVATTPPLVAEETQPEEPPPTRSIIFGEDVDGSSKGGQEKNQTSPGPSRTTRSIRFQ